MYIFLTGLGIGSNDDIIVGQFDLRLDPLQGLGVDRVAIDDPFVFELIRVAEFFHGDDAVMIRNTSSARIQRTLKYYIRAYTITHDRCSIHFSSPALL